MIHIEQHALRAFEQDALAFTPRGVERAPHRAREGEDGRRDLLERGNQRRPIHGQNAEARAQRVMMREQPVELRAECVQMRQIAHADRAAARLVLIRRADAAPRGADLARAARILAQAVKFTVQRKNERAKVGDFELFRCDLDALRAQPGDLFAERPRIEHDAVADHRTRAAHDPARQKAELVDLIADHERMPGIMAALEADHHIGAAREPIDDLALALIAPLGADHGDVGNRYMLLRWPANARGKGVAR